jgi:hypothetical protein
MSEGSFSGRWFTVLLLFPEVQDSMIAGMEKRQNKTILSEGIMLSKVTRISIGGIVRKKTTACTRPLAFKGN